MPRRWPSPSSAGRRLALAAALLAACGGSATPPPPPVIVVAPAGATLFQGQSHVLQVWASGSLLTYQWYRDGVPLPGALDSHYRTPPLGPADDGAAYQVAVSSSGSAPAVSPPARLVVLPPYDLRFRWVGAPLTPAFRELGNQLASEIRTYFDMAAGPLLVGDGICAAPPGAMNCSWFLTGAPGVPGFRARFEAGALADFGAGWLAATPANALVTTLDLQEVAGAFLAASQETTQVGTFSPVSGLLAPGELAALAAAEGAAGRVVTAVSHQGGLVAWISYGWSEAPAERYQARVATSTIAGAGAAAADLGAEGYVVTALGAGNEGADGVVLVGTRREGETAPREVRVVAGSFPLASPPGFVPVGYLFEAATGTWSMILQR